MEIAIMILAWLLLIAVSKWVVYKISIMAILLYFAELGYELPDKYMIQKYRDKVLKKMLHVKED